MASILLHSQEPALQQALTELLPATVHVYDGSAEGSNTATPDLVIIDGAARKDILSALPAEHNPAMLVLLMPGESVDISSLPLAAAATKPLRLSELISLIQQLLGKRQKYAQREIALTDNIAFFPLEKIVRNNTTHQETALTEKESAILYSLHQSSPLQKEELLALIWGYGEQITTHTLETHLYRLRSKLRLISDKEQAIAVADKGYFIDLQ